VGAVTTGGLDTTELAGRLAPHLEALRPGAAVRRLERLPAGLSGITCVADLDSAADLDRIIVKVAVAGVPPTKNRDVLRQARMIELLRAWGRVPVPSVLFTDAGTPPHVPPLYATEFVTGESTEPLDDEEVNDLPGPPELRQRYLHAAAVLGTLHTMPLDQSVTTASGGPAESPDDELDKWARVFAAVPEDLRGNAAKCEELLRQRIPSAGPPAVLHGDYRLGNTICRGGTVAAVIDWEIWSLGDARCDLAWLLHLSDPSSPTARRTLAGVPTRTEMIAAYTSARGVEVHRVGWFDALVLYKRAAATALIVKHNRRSPAPDARKERAAEVIEPLLDAAAQALTESE
jgi:aminoglycoside phosphotransferase (APT) family kinase protein